MPLLSLGGGAPVRPPSKYAPGVDRYIFHTNIQSITQKRMIKAFKLRIVMAFGYPRNNMVYLGFMVTGYGYTAIQCEFELYECLLVLSG